MLMARTTQTERAEARGAAPRAARRARRLRLPRPRRRRALRRQGELDPQAGRLALRGQGRRPRRRHGRHRRADRPHRVDRVPGHRDRGRGAARRAELHQALPAAVQHPAARRQVLSLRRGQPRRGVPARLLHPRAAPAEPRLLRARSRAPSGCARRSTCSASSSSTAPARARSPAGARASPASTTTSSAARRPASATSTGRSTGATSTRSSTSSPAATARSSGDLERQDGARPPRRRTSSGRRSSATGSNAVRSLMERQQVAGGSLGSADLIGVAVEGGDANAQVFQVRDGVLAERQGFYLGERGARRRDPAEVAEEFLAPVLRRGARGPRPRDRRARAARAHGACSPRRSRASATRRSRCGSPSAATCAGCASWPSERQARPRPGQAAPRAPPPAAGRVALRAAGGARPGASCRCGSRASTSPTSARPHRRLDGRLRGRRAEEVRLPQVRHPRRVRGQRRRPGRLRLDGGGARRGGSSRYLEQADLSPHDAERDESFAALPDLIVIDGGKGQLSAGHAGAASRCIERGVAVISLAKRIEEVFVPGRSEPMPARAATRRRCGCCSGSATRRTGSRSTSTAAAATRR